MQAKWLVSRDQKQTGPFTSAELRNMVAAGELRPTDLVCSGGSEKWTQASKIKGLFENLNENEGFENASSPITHTFGITVTVAVGLLGVVLAVALSRNATKPRTEAEQQVEQVHAEAREPRADTIRVFERIKTAAQAGDFDRAAELLRELPSREKGELTNEEARELDQIEWQTVAAIYSPPTSVPVDRYPRRIEHALRIGKTVWILPELSINSHREATVRKRAYATYLVWSGDRLDGIEAQSREIDLKTGKETDAVVSSWIPGKSISKSFADGKRESSCKVTRNGDQTKIVFMDSSERKSDSSHLVVTILVSPLQGDSAQLHWRVTSKGGLGLYIGNDFNPSRSQSVSNSYGYQQEGQGRILTSK